MSFALHPELVPAIAQRMAAGPPPPPADRGDWRRLRADGEAGLAAAEAGLPESADIGRREFTTTSHEGARVSLRWYTPPRSGETPEQPGPAVVHLHGGGMILGSVQLFDRTVAGYVAESRVPMLAVDYRRAPEHPHPAPVEDCWAGLAWLAEHAAELGVDPARIAVMGDSAGGGLAAGTALLARDRGVALARQILVYPMLDDRNTRPDPVLAPFTGWNWDYNYTGWHALLGDAVGTPDVPCAAAPARADDLTGLPTAYIEVGELDIFRDESLDYARRLTAAGVSTELHLHPGCPHGFDRLAPAADIVRRSRADRLRVLRGL
ncbi:alpha/beta hydrolase [Streptomyces sp. NPDC050610]|uniref:alpha/beta hydrolase n=1 Tax=Streptomyces sp. NPDC050610 TaxID=3157097 RepID=UPI00342B87B3